VSSSKTATLLHFLQAVWSFGSDNPTTIFKTNKTMAGSNLFADSAYSYSHSNGYLTSQNAGLIGKSVLDLLCGVWNQSFQRGTSLTTSGYLNRWEKDSSDIDIDNGVVHGVASKRILNIASSAMNKSEVEDTLRKVVEMLVTSKVTGKER
jgi:hypothetical protein